MDFGKFWGGAAAPYEIEQSLRFDGSSYLSWTPSSNGNKRKYTISMWIKRSGYMHYLAFDYEYIIRCKANVSGSDLAIRHYNSNSHSEFEFNQGLNSASGTANTLMKARDPSAWYHLCWVNDYDNSTQADRMVLYINGVRADVSIGSSYQSADGSWNTSGTTHYIGANTTGSDNFKGYIAEFYAVDGQALAPTNFGEYDDNGVWRPIAYSGSYGTNGIYLKFDPSATNGIGHDHSGNGNNWSASGFVTSGTGTDVMSDTPTNNFPTFNPVALERGLNQGNLVVGTGHGNGDFIWTKTMAANQGGNYYWEYNVTSVQSSSDFYFGVLEYTDPIHRWPDWPYGVRDKILAFNVQGTNYQWLVRGSWVNSNAPYGAFSLAVNDVIGVRLDIDNDLITISKNGTVQTGLSGYLSSDTSVYYTPATDVYGNNDQVQFNAGQRAFSHQPTGTTTLCTANLAAPDVASSSEYFKTVLYSGNGQSSQAITGVGFQPDLVWIKNRGTGNNGMLQDVVRGANEALVSAYAVGETLNSGNGHVDSFDSDGFTVGWDGANNGGDTNANGNSYVAWCWKAGGSASSNTAGSITSTVSANPTAGFSVVGYTAQNAVRTIGHGLGKKPELIIVKDRDATQNWAVYHGSLGATKGLYLDLSTKQETNSGYWNNTEPTSTVFTVGTNTRTGGSTHNYIAYCFAEIEGYSKMGTYTGNGSSNGPFIYLGFRPAMILLKNYAGGSETSWILMDSVRDTYNVAHEAHRPNEPDADVTSSLPNTDFLSNGFKIRTSWADMNESTSLFAYFAIAENPFGGDGVTPATAR